MADTHKDLDYLRFFYSSEESLKDKDILKNEAFKLYERNSSILMAVPMSLQLWQLSMVNNPAKTQLFRYVRNLKTFALFGAVLCAWNEKLMLEKKWLYYDRFYPEPTQLQRTLVQEAQMFKAREAAGIKEKSLDDKKYIDPETERIYTQMYQLPPQRYPEAEQDFNPASIKPHYGSS